MSQAMRYGRGERVFKEGGYGGPGFVKTSFVAHDGTPRYVVAFEIKGGHGEFYHVLTETQLMPWVSSVAEEARLVSREEENRRATPLARLDGFKASLNEMQLSLAEMELSQDVNSRRLDALEKRVAGQIDSVSVYKRLNAIESALTLPILTTKPKGLTP